MNLPGPPIHSKPDRIGREPMAWREEYGDDVNWLSWVEDRL